MQAPSLLLALRSPSHSRPILPRPLAVALPGPALQLVRGEAHQGPPAHGASRVPALSFGMLSDWQPARHLPPCMQAAAAQQLSRPARPATPSPAVLQDPEAMQRRWQRLPPTLKDHPMVRWAGLLGLLGPCGHRSPAAVQRGSSRPSWVLTPAVAPPSPSCTAVGRGGSGGARAGRGGALCCSGRALGLPRLQAHRSGAPGRALQPAPLPRLPGWHGAGAAAYRRGGCGSQHHLSWARGSARARRADAAAQRRPQRCGGRAQAAQAGHAALSGGQPFAAVHQQQRQQRHPGVQLGEGAGGAR